MIRPSDLPQESCQRVLISLQDEVDIRLTDLHLSAFVHRPHCLDYEAKLTAIVPDSTPNHRRALMTYVRIDMEKLEGADMARVWILIAEGILLGIEDLNASIENQPFPAPAKIWTP